MGGLLENYRKDNLLLHFNHVHSEPPHLYELPDDVKNEFSFGGRVRLFHLYFRDDAASKTDTDEWTRENIEMLRTDFTRNQLRGTFKRRISYGKSMRLPVQEISSHIDRHMLANVSKIPFYSQLTIKSEKYTIYYNAN